MGSRLRVNPDKLFEVFAEVARPQQDGEDPFILQKYPPDYDEQGVLNSIPKFAFPCKNNTSQVDQFAFVLTDMDSMYRYGYCRHGTGAQTCLCIISHLPWFEVFYKMLNFLAEIINRTEKNDVAPFLKAAYEQTIPMPDEPVTIVAGQDMFNFTAPDPTSLPSIPASRNLTEYYNAVDTNNMMRIFASMLHERRIMITSKKLSRVTACIHAAEALLYPMNWQHIFIPVLPANIIDYVAAPMPYLIGVHTSLMEKIERNRMEIGDAVIVDADKNEVRSQYDDLEALPEDVSSYLKRHLKTQKVQTSMMQSGDAISRAFLQALVRLIGGYRDALRFRSDHPITFDKDAFVVSRPSQSMQTFLESMLQLQIFDEFIKGRLELLNSGEGFHDLFEQESLKYADSLNTQSKYKEWLSKQKRKIKAGGKDIISDMKDKAGPMMNTAVNTMKSQGKRFQSKLKEINENKMSSSKVRGGVVHSRSSGSDRPRPTTIVGSNLLSSRVRPPRPPLPLVSGSHRPQTITLSAQGSDRAKVYRTLEVDDEHGTHDDSNLRLSYHTIDVGLMSDSDIQNAIRRAASADPLPQQDALTPNASDGDVSSTPSSEALSPSDENLDHIPYMDIRPGDHDISPFAPNSSSDEDLKNPPPLPGKDSKPPPLSGRHSHHPVARDRLIVTDRLIGKNRPASVSPIAPPRLTRNASPQLPRLPVPMRRTSLDKKSTPDDDDETPPPLPSKPPPPENELIRFESSESETDGMEQFDPLHSTTVSSGRSPASADGSPQSSSPGLSRNKSHRNSLMRHEAFRRTDVEGPVRQTYRDDISPEKETDPKNVLADLFDPLAGASTVSAPTSSATSMASHNGQTSEGDNAGSASLMHDWTLGHLAGGSGGFTKVPSGGTLTCPASAGRPVSPSAGTNSLYRPPPPRPQPPKNANSFAVDGALSATSAPSARPPQRQTIHNLDSLISLDLGGTGSSGRSSPARGNRTTGSSSPSPTPTSSRVSLAVSRIQANRSSSTLPANLTGPKPQRPPPRKSMWETFD
ncbi:DENN domain-containing protein 1B-like isoform X3 [Littorina saxatilis]|uniref:DENN domain-containing protein 1B-like isoform X3 n=1 Tax=Littorina saxatilis TaxID=31220 RepID=UPI0038B66404